MNKLTAEAARMDIGNLKLFQANPHVGLSLKEEKYLQALEIALPVLENPDGWVEHAQRKPVEQGDYQIYLRSGQVSCGFFSGEILDEYPWCIFTSLGEVDMPCHQITHWKPMSPPPQPQPSTNPQIDNDGWVEWRGGKRPVGSAVMVATMCRNGACAPPELAVYWEWGHNNSDLDIIAYRVIENDGREG
jgi:hypothetical protein